MKRLLNAVLFSVATVAAVAVAEERYTLDEWLDLDVCSKLIRVEVEDKKRIYVVMECVPGERMTDFEVKEYMKAMDIKFGELKK